MTESSNTVKEVIDRLYQLKEPETDRLLGDLNLVAEVRMLDDGTIAITFIPTSPCSPTAVNLGLSIRNAAQAVNSAKKVVIQCNGHLMDEVVNRLVNKDQSRQM